MFLKIFQATFLKCFLCLWKVFFPKFLWFKKQDLKCCFTIYFNAHNNATFFIGHMILSEKSDKILFNKKIFKSYLLAKSFLLVTCDCFIWPLLTYRSSQEEVLLGKGVLKICSKITGSVISISAWVFSCKLAAYFQNTFS